MDVRDLMPDETPDEFAALEACSVCNAPIAALTPASLCNEKHCEYTLCGACWPDAKVDAYCPSHAPILSKKRGAAGDALSLRDVYRKRGSGRKGKTSVA